MHPPTTLAMTQALLGGRGGSLAHPRIPQHYGTGALGGPWGEPGAPADPPARWHRLLGGRGGSLAHPRIPQHDGTGSWGAVGEAWRTRGSPSTMAQAPGGPRGERAPPTWNEDCRMMSCQRIPRHAVAQGAAHDAATLLRRRDRGGRRGRPARRAGELPAGQDGRD